MCFFLNNWVGVPLQTKTKIITRQNENLKQNIERQCDNDGIRTQYKNESIVSSNSILHEIM